MARLNWRLALFLYLSSRISSELGDTFRALVDLLHGSPEGTVKHDDGVGVSIEPGQFDFRIEAQHLLWAGDQLGVAALSLIQHSEVCRVRPAIGLGN
jgi:hypothetical protein